MELTAADIARLLPKRDENAHKGDFGRVLLLCGSRGYTGAAYFAAMGALRTGAGLVYLGVPESIYAIEAVKLNEPVVFPLPEQGGRLSEAAVPEILEKIPRMDAVLIGPGLGLGQGSFAVLKAVLTHAACPVVVDADGITLLVPHMDILRGREAPTILTPHDGEFTRLFGPVAEDRMASARAAALESRGIMLLKGTGPASPTASGSIGIRPETPEWPLAAAEMCWPAFWCPCWVRGWSRWRRRPAPPGSMGRPGTCAPGSWGSTACSLRTFWTSFRDF